MKCYACISVNVCARIFPCMCVYLQRLSKLLISRIHIPCCGSSMALRLIVYAVEGDTFTYSKVPLYL